MSVLRYWAALAPFCLLAQQPNPPAPTIRTTAPLVLVPVTVTDSKGTFIDGLKEEDFRLTDDAVVQKIHLDTSDTVLAPVAMVLAIQSSGISAPALAKIRQIGGLIQPLLAGDRGQAAVLAFDSEVRLMQDFTRDGADLRAAFEHVEPRVIKRAKLHDAVVEAVRMLETRPESYRRVLFLVSESRDRGSKTKLDEANVAAQRANVVIYAITYSAQLTAWTAKPQDNPPMPGGPDYAGGVVELTRLGMRNSANVFARSSGGLHLSFARLDGLENAVARVAEEIHSQYLLSFVPQPTSNRGFHRTYVTVPSRPGAVIRARPGYWQEK